MEIPYIIDGGVMHLRSDNRDLSFSFVLAPAADVKEPLKAKRVVLDYIINLDDEEFISRILNFVGQPRSDSMVKRAKNLLCKLREEGASDHNAKYVLAKTLIAEFKKCSIV